MLTGMERMNLFWEHLERFVSVTSECKVHVCVFAIFYLMY